MRGYLTFLNILDHIEVNTGADSPECFPFLHVKNAMPAPGWFHPQEKCLNRQQLAGFPLFPQGYQKKSEKKIKMKFPTALALITSFEGEIDITESKIQRSCVSLQIYLGQIWTPALIRLQGHAALFTRGISCKSPPCSSHLPSLHTFLESTLILWISISQNSFYSFIQKYFFQACPLPLPFRIYRPQPMCNRSSQLPRSATSHHNSCFLILTSVYNLIFLKYYYI